MNPLPRVRSGFLLGVGIAGLYLPVRGFAACDDSGMSTVARSQCAQAAADASGGAMSRSLDRALAAAQRMNEHGRAPLDFRQAISESQRLWEAWKEAQCRLEADVTMGSAGAYVLPLCRERLTIARTRSLDDLANQLSELR